jgi:hypothetical protein
MAAMVRDVVEFGLPAYARYATPEAIVAAMPTFPVILSESGRFAMMPVARTYPAGGTGSRPGSDQRAVIRKG